MNPLVNEKIRVKIYGKEYELDPGGLTPLEASQLAAFVDQKMREIAEKLRVVDTQKIAVLAALNIAFDLTVQRDRTRRDLSEDDQRRVQDMIAQLEKAIK